MVEATQHIPTVIQTLEPIVSQYGYVAVGGLLFLEDFGIPVPGETILIAAAFYAGLGQLNIVAVIIVGFIGAVLGDNVGYAIGTYGGHPLVERYGKYVLLPPARLHKAEQFFNKHGGKVVVVARFISGLRQLNGIIAGLSEMRWLKFITYNMIGAAIWVSFWSAVGFYGGNHISVFLRSQLYATLTLAVIAILFVGYKVIERRAEKEPKD